MASCWALQLGHADVHGQGGADQGIALLRWQMVGVGQNVAQCCAYQCMGRAVARVRAGGQLVHQVQARIAVVRQELLQPRIKLQNFGFKITHLRRIRQHQSQGRL